MTNTLGRLSVMFLVIYVVILVQLSNSPANPSSPTLPLPPPTGHILPTIEATIISESLNAGISPHIPLAVAYRESKFDPLAVSKENRDGSRDWGLFQLNDTTLRRLHIENRFDIRENTIAGVGLIANYLKFCLNEHEAISHGYATGRCVYKRSDSSDNRRKITAICRGCIKSLYKLK